MKPPSKDTGYYRKSGDSTMGNGSAIEIKTYEPWMLDGLAELTSRQYGDTVDANKAYIEHQLFHPFAKDHSIILAAQAGERVVGMYAYMYWPYAFKGETFNSMQSGMLLVDEEYRRRGIFSRFAEMANRIHKEREVSFVTGFPTAMSIGGAIKAGFVHIGTPMTMIRPLMPMKLLASKLRHPMKTDWVDKQSSSNKLTFTELIQETRSRIDCKSAICLKTDSDFMDYRYRGKDDQYRIYGYGEGRTDIVFICKMGFRDNVLYIGDIQVRDQSFHLLGQTLDELIADVRREGNIYAIAMLVNVRRFNVMRILLRNCFLPYPSMSTKFTVMPVCMESGKTELITDYSNWNIMASDIDIW